MAKIIEFETRRPIIERQRLMPEYDALIAKGIAFVLEICGDRKTLLGLARNGNSLPFESDSIIGILYVENGRTTDQTIKTIIVTTHDPKTHDPLTLGIFTDDRIREIFGFFLSDGIAEQQVRIDPIGFTKAAKAVRRARKETPLPP